MLLLARPRKCFTENHSHIAGAYLILEEGFLRMPVKGLGRGAVFRPVAVFSTQVNCEAKGAFVVP